MTIRPREGAFQVDVSFEGLRRQRQAPDEVAAKLLEIELLAELKDEVNGKESKKWTLETVALVWKDSKSEKTHEKNSRLILKYFGKSTLLSEIDTDSIDQWIANMEEHGNSGSTINRKIACLSKIMSVAIQRGALAAKPKFQRQQEGTGRVRWLTYGEEKTLLGLLKQWGKDDHHDLIVFLLDTGCRPSEAYKLTSKDVSLESGMVHFWETKNGHPRSVPITLRVREILERRTKDAVRPFPFNDAWLRNQWDRARNMMGLRDDTGFVPYACRHTCASRMAQKGVPLVVIKEWMGHKTIQITLRYSHLGPGALQVGLKALETTGDSVASSG
jgi:integrase